MKPFLSEKAKFKESITLIENNAISHNDQNNTEIFNNFFINAVKNLNFEIIKDSINSDARDDQILTAIKMFENHPTIIMIKVFNTSNFSFKLVIPAQVHDEIIALNSSKACPKESILPKIIKENCDIFTNKLHDDINYSIRYGNFLII